MASSLRDGVGCPGLEIGAGVECSIAFDGEMEELYGCESRELRRAVAAPGSFSIDLFWRCWLSVIGVARGLADESGCDDYIIRCDDCSSAISSSGIGVFAIFNLLLLSKCITKKDFSYFLPCF